MELVLRAADGHHRPGGDDAIWPGCRRQRCHPLAYRTARHARPVPARPQPTPPGLLPAVSRKYGAASCLVLDAAGRCGSIWGAARHLRPCRVSRSIWLSRTFGVIAAQCIRAIPVYSVVNAIGVDPGHSIGGDVRGRFTIRHVRRGDRFGLACVVVADGDQFGSVQPGSMIPSARRRRVQEEAAAAPDSSGRLAMRRSRSNAAATRRTCARMWPRSARARSDARTAITAMSTIRLLRFGPGVHDACLRFSILGRYVVERGRSAAGAARPPTPLVVTSHRDHRGGDGLGSGRFVASWLPTRTPALAEIDADDLTGRRLHPRHLIPRQLRPDAIAVRQASARSGCRNRA